MTYQMILTYKMISTYKTLADDKSIFSKVLDKGKSQRDLNNDLSIISEWTFQWKMLFNPDPNNQANEVYFSRIIFLLSLMIALFNCVNHKNI